MREPTPVYTNRLQCVECGRASQENERGWTARLTYGDEVVVYCPGCDEREFSARREGGDTSGK
jgi:translation initiation factor 2 gamma subunit (eIF-2gamma)